MKPKARAGAIGKPRAEVLQDTGILSCPYGYGATPWGVKASPITGRFWLYKGWTYVGPKG